MGWYGVVNLQILAGYTLPLDNQQIWHGYLMDKSTCYLWCIHGMSTLNPAVIHTPILQEHPMNEHDVKTPWNSASRHMLTCNDCEIIFKSTRSLFGHMKEKHSVMNEVYSCQECGKAFGRKRNLVAHIQAIHDKRKFPCQVCDRIFNNRTSMYQHIRETHKSPQWHCSNIQSINLCTLLLEWEINKSYFEGQ